MAGGVADGREGEGEPVVVGGGGEVDDGGAQQVALGGAERELEAAGGGALMRADEDVEAAPVGVAGYEAIGERLAGLDVAGRGVGGVLDAIGPPGRRPP